MDLEKQKVAVIIGATGGITRQTEPQFSDD